jgi:hypothetical protein
MLEPANVGEAVALPPHIPLHLAIRCVLEPKTMETSAPSHAPTRNVTKFSHKKNIAGLYNRMHGMPHPSQKRIFSVIFTGVALSRRATVGTPCNSNVAKLEAQKCLHGYAPQSS